MLFRSNKVLVDRIELVNGIKRVAVCSNPTTNLIRMDIADNRITLTAQDIDFSVSANETISCSYDGQPISIGFKSTFLVEILSNMDTPTVGWNWPTRPAPASSNPFTTTSSRARRSCC